MLYYQCDRCGKKALDGSEGRTYIPILSYNDALSYSSAHGMPGIWLCENCQKDFERFLHGDVISVLNDGFRGVEDD